MYCQKRENPNFCISPERGDTISDTLVSISKKIFRVAGRTGQRDTDLQNPENAHFQAQKNLCSRTNSIKICDACDLKMTQILHFYNKIFGLFKNKVVLRSYTLAWGQK